MKININTFLFQYLQLHVLLVNDTRNGQVHVMLHAVWTSKIAFHISGDVLQVIIKLILCINIYIVINYIVNEIYMYIKESLTNLNLSFDMFQRSMLHFNFIEISISFLLFFLNNQSMECNIIHLLVIVYFFVKKACF